MSTFLNILFLYALTAVISFAVAFLIKIMSAIIGIKRTKKPEFANLSAQDITRVQNEAANIDKGDEVYAAIALALHLYTQEIHDIEQMRMTIHKTVKSYSPWSSKIYGLNRYQRK